MGALHGDVASLGRLTELRVLWLANTAVRGEVGSLAVLSRLESLRLGGTDVHGSVASLRALPGLDNVWSSFTACENYAEGWFNDDVSCNDLGLVRVAQAEAVAGHDECACCVGPQLLVRNETTGVCLSNHLTPVRASSAERSPGYMVILVAVTVAIGDA